ncbi:histidine phosphatase family protein [Paramaledivibacter caminithermalis]|jgi:probable phosphoglycerate mutase|uniref:Probable phosphoglycerate mutase n=1 Tax=Paramaledivibacter caminithermalis (strain DSM 15212 / CIP 107654 / DViRD3) TaxID=1121301 RepID=A0A1M6JM52_PARC5|nr:histidine phosphatase family protein [Paramaledivibacter caminithermalis]SHJ47714.1 probable phosphoglycerate mutase [Paramaledivibacter caminithermalis DSM 15212]
MLKLYLIRHGETQWNCEAKTQGCKNIDLSKLGLLQGRLLANKLKKLNEDYLKIYTSDLDRCYLTAKAVSEELKIDVEVHKDLREMSFGDWEGLTLEEIRKAYFKEYLRWRTEPHKAYIPKGESLKAVQNRCLNSVKKIIRKHNNGSVIIISHGVAIKTMIFGLLGLDLKHFYSISLNNASLNKLEFRDYGPVLTSLNDTCHLDSKNV